MNTIKLSLCAAAAAALLGGAGAASAAEYANVVSATPVTGSVAVPRQACADVERTVQPQPSGAGALIGAIAGGVIGNQFGHGFGRAAATGLGVVAGSSIGNQVEANGNPPVTVAGRDCRTVSQYQNRVIGYDVVYEYNGQRYTTRTASDPGARIAIDVRPSDASYDRGAPQAAYADATPAYGSAPTYVESPAPAYYAPPPAYGYYPPAYYAPGYYGPTIGIGIGYGYGWHRGYGRHW